MPRLHHRAHAIARFSAAKLAGARTRAHAFGREVVVAAVCEVSEEADTTLALASFALADVGLTRTSVSLGRRPAWRLVDEAGQGAADAVVIARFAAHPRAYSMVLYADPRGIVDAPTGLAEALVANIVLSDGSFRCDLEWPTPSADGAPMDVGVGHIESYEITLESGGAPLAWHRVSICSEAPLDLGQLLMSDDRGHIGPLAIRSGGRPRLVVHDPRLVELGRSFALELGMNRVSVARRRYSEAPLTPVGSDCECAWGALRRASRPFHSKARMEGCKVADAREHVRALLEHGMDHSEWGDVAEALRLFDQAAAINPDGRAIKYLRGEGFGN